MAISSGFTPLARKLASDPRIQPEDIAAMAELSIKLRTVPANTEIIRDGEQSTQACLVVEGFLHRFKLIEKGKRRILSFHVPGDFPDLQGLHLDVSDHYLGTLTPSTVALFPNRELREALFANPRLDSFFWRVALTDAAIFREWIVNVGRRDGYARVAHLICELAVRLKAVGRGDDSGFTSFLTQQVIADATGLTAVHVNRVIKKLTDNGYISHSRTRIAINDWPSLTEAAGFDPAYLHLR